MNTITEIETDIKRNAAARVDDRHDLILFDGVCNLCNGWVRFVVKRDPHGRFRFAALQSEAARDVLPDGAVPEGTDSIILFKGGRVYTRSAAILRIVSGLRAPWPLLTVLRVIPTFIRDFIYDWVATNRYRWFGRRDECMIPTPELRERFLD